MSRSGFSEVIWYALPMAIAIALLLKGITQLLAIPEAGYDLRLRWTDVHYLLRGANPFDASFYYDDLRKRIDHVVVPMHFADLGWPEMANYPRTSTLTLILLFGLPLTLTKYYYVAANAIAFAVVAWWASDKVEGPSAWRILLAGIAVANLGYSQTIINGNLGILVLAALVLSIALRRERPLLAGLLLGIALVKPTISAPFVLLFLAERRYVLLSATAAWLLASIVLTVGMTGVDVISLFRQSVEGSSRFATGGYSVLNALKTAGVSQAAALLTNALLFLIPLALVVWRAARHSRVFSLATLAVSGVVARLFTYHNSIDNVILTFLTVALVHCALVRRNLAAGAFAVLVSVSLLIPLRLTDSGLAHVGLYCLWTVATGYVGWTSLRGAVLSLPL